MYRCMNEIDLCLTNGRNDANVANRFSFAVPPGKKDQVAFHGMFFTHEFSQKSGTLRGVWKLFPEVPETILNEPAAIKTFWRFVS